MSKDFLNPLKKTPYGHRPTISKQTQSSVNFRKKMLLCTTGWNTQCDYTLGERNVLHPEEEEHVYP